MPREHSHENVQCNWIDHVLDLHVQDRRRSIVPLETRRLEMKVVRIPGGNGLAYCCSVDLEFLMTRKLQSSDLSPLAKMRAI